MAKSTYAEWAELLRVLAHPTRLAILDSLKDGTKCVNDVCEILSVPQPNLSQHLSILRREGVVSFTEDGKKRCYFLTNPALIKALMCVLARDATGDWLGMDPSCYLTDAEISAAPPEETPVAV